MIQLHANAPDLHCFKLDLSPRCVLQAERFWARNQERPLSPILLSLKAFRNHKICFPFFSSLLGPRCVSLHTRVSAFRCGRSTPCPPPSDWWRMTCMPWCLSPTGELTAGCVHIACTQSAIPSFDWWRPIICKSCVHCFENSLVTIGPLRALINELTFKRP